MFSHQGPRTGGDAGKEAKNAKSALIINYNLAKCREILSDLHVRISDYATTDQFYEEYELALYEYFECRNVTIEDGEAPDEFFRDEEEFDRFMAWYALYFITDGHSKTFPALYRQQNKYQISPFEEEILKSYAASYLGLYEVQRVDPGKGFDLLDLFSERTYRVQDPYHSRIFCKWDIIYAGLVSGSGMTFLSGFDPLSIPLPLRRTLCQRILEMFEAERQEAGSIEELLRTHSAGISAMIEDAMEKEETEPCRNNDGDCLRLTFLHYRISDPESFHRRIDESPFFSRDVEDADFRRKYRWIRRTREGLRIFDTPPLGILTVDRNWLKAECNSVERAGKLRKLLDDTFGSLLQYRTTVCEDPGLRIPLPAGLHGEVENPTEKSYVNWLDEEVPALGGVTPREAVMTPDGREFFLDLLKELENAQEKILRLGVKLEGLPLFPVDRIRKELGLS